MCVCVCVCVCVRIISALLQLRVSAQGAINRIEYLEEKRPPLPSSHSIHSGHASVQTSVNLPTVT